MKMKITKRTVDSLEPKEKAYTVNDSDLPGFEVKVLPSGRKVFFAYYRYLGQRRRPAVGEYGKVTTEQAREEARKVISAASLGHDPSAARQEARRMMLFQEFVNHYLADAKQRTKTRTHEENVRRLDLHILPELGKMRLNAITKGDIAILHQRLAVKHQVERDGFKGEVGGQKAANRVLSLLKAIFNKAIEMGIIHQSPANHIKPYPEKSRERFLSGEELKALADALDWADEEETLENVDWEIDRIGKRHKIESRPSPWATAAIRLLLFTGARRNEILSLKWDHVDLEGRRLLLEDSKTGTKIIHLNEPAVLVLQRLKEIQTEGNPWVIEGARYEQRISNIQSPWERIRARAGLDGLRLHDLRHVHASMAVLAGISLPFISRILGHSTTRMTERYAHLAADPIKAASELVGGALLAAMSGGAKAGELAEDSAPIGADPGAEVAPIGERAAKC